MADQTLATISIFVTVLRLK